MKKKITAAQAELNSKEIIAFYKMLLKFEKLHPEFSAKNVMDKLYPKSAILFLLDDKGC